VTNGETSKMYDNVDRKSYRKSKMEQKNKHHKKNDEEYRKDKSIKHDLKNKKQEMDDEETWEYWKDVYK
jgi:formylmethanofuran dehydrogenase subunit E